MLEGDTYYRKKNVKYIKVRGMRRTKNWAWF